MSNRACTISHVWRARLQGELAEISFVFSMRGGTRTGRRKFKGTGRFPWTRAEVSDRFEAFELSRFFRRKTENPTWIGVIEQVVVSTNAGVSSRHYV